MSCCFSSHDFLHNYKISRQRSSVGLCGFVVSVHQNIAWPFSWEILHAACMPVAFQTVGGYRICYTTDVWYLDSLHRYSLHIVTCYSRSSIWNMFLVNWIDWISCICLLLDFLIKKDNFFSLSHIRFNSWILAGLPPTKSRPLENKTDRYRLCSLFVFSAVLSEIRQQITCTFFHEKNSVYKWSRNR